MCTTRLHCTHFVPYCAHRAVVEPVTQQIKGTFARFETPDYKDEDWFKALTAAKNILNPATP